jgi:type II secretory pathway pseudopilin PulG
MHQERGFTLLEVLVLLGMIGVISAVSVPYLSDSSSRNAVWTAGEQVASQVRQARLKAITRNRSFRLRFNCPAIGQFRVLEVTGTAGIDNAANRCTMYLPLDSGIYTMPRNVSFGNPPVLQVNGRGQYTLPAGGTLPLTINVQYGATHTRSFTVSATGQITFAAF